MRNPKPHSPIAANARPDAPSAPLRHKELERALGSTGAIRALQAELNASSWIVGPSR